MSSIAKILQNPVHVHTNIRLSCITIQSYYTVPLAGLSLSDPLPYQKDLQGRAWLKATVYVHVYIQLCCAKSTVATLSLHSIQLSTEAPGDETIAKPFPL